MPARLTASVQKPPDELHPWLRKRAVFWGLIVAVLRLCLWPNVAGASGGLTRDVARCPCRTYGALRKSELRMALAISRGGWQLGHCWAGAHQRRAWRGRGPGRQRVVSRSRAASRLGDIVGGRVPGDVADDVSRPVFVSAALARGGFSPVVRAKNIVTNDHSLAVRWIKIVRT